MKKGLGASMQPGLEWAMGSLATPRPSFGAELCMQEKQQHVRRALKVGGGRDNLKCQVRLNKSPATECHSLSVCMQLRDRGHNHHLEHPPRQWDTARRVQT